MSIFGHDEQGGTVHISNKQRKLVRKAEREPWNRLLSVLQDAEWVMNFCQSQLPRLPILPNLRCGAWYVPPTSAQVERWGCYFKSTDGHTNEWGFSLKRYNPGVLTIVQERGGCIIVDSTRRGKSMPDALSKTVPIWCAVINQAANRRYGETSSQARRTLRLPDNVVSPSEQAQIARRIAGWVEDLLDSDLEVPRLAKPLRPIFITRSRVDEELANVRLHAIDYFPIVLVSASPMEPTPNIEPKTHDLSDSASAALGFPKDVEELRRLARYVYVQGSGDDEEMWSTNLTPSLMWDLDNLRQILQTKGKQPELDSCLATVVMQHHFERANLTGRGLDSDKQIGSFDIWFGRRTQTHDFEEAEKERYRLIIHADGKEDEETEANGDVEKVKGSCKILRLALESGKRGLHAYRNVIFEVIANAQAVQPGGPILLCSAEADGMGHNLNAGLAVCILATCYDADKRPFQNNTRPDAQAHIPPTLTKDDIQKRLQWITTLVPQAKPPSRKHMLRINEALLSQDIRTQVQQQRRSEVRY